MPRAFDLRGPQIIDAGAKAESHLRRCRLLSTGYGACGDQASLSRPQQAASAEAIASFMMRRIVRAHLPHWALQPRQW
jgi:hypothetical protein